MVIKIGKFRFSAHFAKNDGGSWQTGIAVSIDETTVSEQCEFWFIIAFETKMPLYAGVAKGRYNDEVKTLQSIDFMIWKGKVKCKHN